VKWNVKIEKDNHRGSGWRCRAEDNCGRGRKDRQRITTGVVDRRTVQRKTTWNSVV